MVIQALITSGKQLPSRILSHAPHTSAKQAYGRCLSLATPYIRCANRFLTQCFVIRANRSRIKYRPPKHCQVQLHKLQCRMNIIEKRIFEVLYDDIFCLEESHLEIEMDNRNNEESGNEIASPVIIDVKSFRKCSITLSSQPCITPQVCVAGEWSIPACTAHTGAGQRHCSHALTGRWIRNSSWIARGR
jgi:hypothetical protein